MSPHPSDVVVPRPGSSQHLPLLYYIILIHEHLIETNSAMALLVLGKQLDSLCRLMHLIQHCSLISTRV